MPLKPRFALAVDDEPSDLDNVRHILANAGYQLFTAPDANSAMEIFQRHADKIEVLVTDVAMSPVGGYDLAASPDIDSMQGYGLDLSSYADVKERAAEIYEALAKGSMPCDEAWPKERVELFKQWMDEGFAP